MKEIRIAIKRGSLKIAIERKKAKLIQENNFQYKKENNLNFERKQGNDFTNYLKKKRVKLKRKMGREKRTKLMKINLKIF